MATILCLTLLSITVLISLVAAGVPLPFVVAGVGLLGVSLSENAIVASIGFGLFATSFTGLFVVSAAYTVQHAPTKEDDLILKGMKAFN